MNQNNTSQGFVGKPIKRVEGLEKVTGTAKYAAEYPLKDLAYGVIISSKIVKGRILEINSQQAEQLPGVLAVISHLNSPEVPGRDISPASAIPIFSGNEFKPFQNDQIRFNLQPAAMVIADTLQLAQYAATLVSVRYEEEAHETDLEKQLEFAVKPDKPSDYLRGDASAWKHAPVILEQEYQTPIQVHNAMEPHAATAYWEGEHLFIFNKTQSVKTTQQQFAQYFNLKPENVHVHAPFVGGAFGSSSRMWPHEMAAVLGAKKVKRPVQIALSREQVFNMVGYRPHSVQKYNIGAHAEGKILGINHEAYGLTSRYEQFMERILDPTKSMYNTANINSVYKLVPLDVNTPCPARGPGETSGSFAMESAVDELAYQLKMDPLEFRLKNFAETDLNKNVPWSSNHLKECYRIGAEKFGWQQRNSLPGSTKIGEILVGTGMSAGIYKSERTPSEASLKIFDDGKVLIQSSVSDNGQGSATILTQIAADALGVDLSQIQIEWADSKFPMAPPQYGSHTTNSIGSAIYEAALALKKKLADLNQSSEADLKRIDYGFLLKKHNLKELEASVESKPGDEKDQYSSKSFCANFVEVQIHAETREVKVTRVVSVIDCGRIINHQTAHSQALGSIVWGIGIALMEEGIIDHNFGRYVNNNLTDYHVPVNADVPNIEIHFIEKPDDIATPIGTKGLGEIALIGFSAAVANAVFHATGKRIRQLPITLDKLL
ncbi:xanthine dehydrogenase family protein molybdopterin-binding subunit [uncultured Mucilaginibacter sp.]|uniref:xanthine dehydrogenase family protein molybdopterin-binding subunit n=1 Tax=uncultured Mucilaginibacter sp. TaxID=797541 RepID=UPI002620DCA8|nr:xanthine dehydrogenase family protein molybdopterin-binding subunit [uncultured Mucilaginibacter sp.]